MVKIKLKGKGRRVLREFQQGKLKTRDGKKIKNYRQALAVAFSEQREANKRNRGS